MSDRSVDLAHLDWLIDYDCRLWLFLAVPHQPLRVDAYLAVHFRYLSVAEVAYSGLHGSP